MFCTKCGKENSDGAAFCGSCGEKLKKVSVPGPSTGNPVLDFLNSTKMNAYALIGFVIIAISVFLPYMKVSFWGMSESVKLIDGSDGKIILVVAIVGAVLAYLKNNKGTTICAGACLAVLLLEEINFASEAKESGMGALVKDTISRQFGFYLLLVGSIFVLVNGILRIKKNK